MPVGFEFDGSHFYVGGHGETARTRKFRNVREGNPRVALVIDDLASTDPWSPRGMRIYGTAEFVERAGAFGAQTYLRITPSVTWSWNLAGKPYTGQAGKPKRTVHAA